MDARDRGDDERVVDDDGDGRTTERSAAGVHDDAIEPGRPTAENAAFVLLGALATVYVLARLAGLV